MKKTLISLFLALGLGVGTLLAQSGTCGDNLTWTLDNDTLTISGTGDMTNFSYGNPPWKGYRSSITTVIINSGVTSIGSSACHMFTHLTSITIPNSVTSIGEDAFYGCANLKDVYISDIVAWYAISFADDNNSNPLYWARNIYINDKATKNITIPNTLQKSSDNDPTVKFFNNFTHIEAPAWFFDEEESEWPSCPKYLESVTINSGEMNDNVFGVISRSYKTLTTLDVSAVSNTDLADEAFKGYYNLTSLALPQGLERIGYMTIADCKSLQAITIPTSVEEIDNSAFENCRSLKSITFGGQQTNISGRLNAPAASESRLQRIGNWAFYNCHELQNLTIPEGVKEIGDGAFYGCVYMENLILPASVRAIGDNTFALCSKLQKIEVRSATPPEIEQKTFYDVQRRIPVYVPDDSVDAYKDDALWGEFNIQGESGMLMDIPTVSASAAQSQVQKIMHNGQLYILRDGKVYNAVGAEVK